VTQATNVERATSGYCPARFFAHEYDGDKLVTRGHEHEPVLDADGNPERAILPGEVYCCRHCRILYWPETSGEYFRRMQT
jgi:hypothetical protein